MRFAVVAILCLSVVVLTTANDLSVGKREIGDVIVSSRRLLRPAVPGNSMVAKTGFNTGGVITYVKATNAQGSDADVMIVKGGPGDSKVVVTATSAPGAGLDVQVDIYAIELPGGNTEPPASP